VHRSKELSLFEARSCVDELGHPSKLPLRLEAHPGHAGFVVVRFTKPTSSVMISKTFGAPFGGTTRGGHHGVDSEAFSLITPPNFGSAGGSCFPVIVVVASGEPGTPVIC
jgi:hypothetical protein